MKRLKIILLLLLSSGLITQASDIIWNSETRTLAISNSGTIPWIVEGKAQIRLAGGMVFSTSDQRFKVTVYELHNRTILSGTDTGKIIDWEMVIASVDNWSVRIDMTIYNRGPQSLKLDRIDLLEGRLTGAADPVKNRCLVNGMHSWDGAEVIRMKTGSKIESYYTLAVQSPAVAAGYLAGRHNLNRFLLNPRSDGIDFLAYGECNQCVLPSGASRSADPLFLSAGANPLKQMEVFADLAAKETGVQLWPENFATWCSWYAGWMRQESIYEFKDGLEHGVETNVPLIRKSLGTRGTLSMRVVDDSNEMPYGDWDDRTVAVPGGFRRLAGMMTDSGIKAGVWYPPFWVSSGSRLFQGRPDLLCKNDDGQVAVGKKALIPENMYGNHLAFLDASNPEAESQMEATARTWRNRGFRYVMTDFMYWGAWPQKRFDSTLTAVEAYNLGLQAMRSGYGKDTYWLHCGALLGPAMGYSDGMRIGGDSFGDGIFAYESSAARWFYNWRLWINDPDAIICRHYGVPRGIEWSRSWMSWMALSGNVLTYGDTFDDLPEEYLQIYRKILPPLPMAGRPLDIWENEPYMLWGMNPGKADGPYTLFGVFEFQGKGSGEVISLNLDEIEARSKSWDESPEESPERWLLWDFWQQRLTKVTGPLVTIPVPSGSCNVFSLRPCLGRPQLLGTSGHFSQGTIETREIMWNTKSGILSGRVKGNGGDSTTLFFYVPNGMKCISASVAFLPGISKLIGPDVLALEVPPVKGDPVLFELSFTGLPGKYETRKFTAGVVGNIKIK